MSISVYWYSYQYFIRKLYSKRNKENSVSIQILSLLFIFIIILFLISLFAYLFEIKTIRSIFSSGIPLGPLAGIIAIVIITLYYIVFKPKLNYKIIGKMKEAYLRMQYVSKNWVIFAVAIIFVLFISSIVLMALT